ncbi:hypothetical protein GYMLUDRAFT_251492 [Collybiopsis luxurians FD-317 M1]|uniref:Uncharacterized protein n=1 Tax=Collybiopsis luxurians FD-317 M1 TaxID=944289 RepID=A0A0D0CBB3_9AGAR|nr:hypothetical protein GYMLUDRAFT_251492 [Collybiopsis luxurians FD-317 M1]
MRHDSSCLRFYYWQGYSGVIACMIAEAILQMRLYALYSLNRKILYLMIGCFILSSATSIAVVNFVLANIQTASHLIPGFPFCFPINIPRYFYALWIPILAFETVLFVLAAFQGYLNYRLDGFAFRSEERLVKILIRDSIIYYGVVLVTYLACLLVMVINVNFFEVPIPFSLALSCTFGNRTILNVREAHRDAHQTMAVASGPRRPTTDTPVGKALGTNSPQAFTFDSENTDSSNRSTGDIFEMEFVTSSKVRNSY